MFAYRPGNGDLMLVAVTPLGEPIFFTKTRTLGLPAVGTETTVWNVDVDVSNVAQPLYARTHTITAVDTVAGTYTRNSTTLGTTPPSTRPETVAINDARNGYSHRSPATVTDSNSASVTVREFYSLSLRGTGLSVVYLPANNTTGASNALFELSVQQ